MQEIRETIPARLFERDTLTSFYYLGRDITMMTALYLAVTRVDIWFNSLSHQATEQSLFVWATLKSAHWLAWLI